ncbi:MAG: hypothetical protein V1727_01855 [Candidatus Omnitrophota bacterium]
MNKGILLFFIGLICFTALYVLAEDQTSIKIGPGMELLEVGAVRVLVPKGTHFADKGSKVEVESIGEYVGRRFLDVEARLTTMEEKDQSLKVELDSLKKELEALKQKAAASEAPVQQEKQGKKLPK